MPHILGRFTRNMALSLALVWGAGVLLTAPVVAGVVLEHDSALASAPGVDLRTLAIFFCILAWCALFAAIMQTLAGERA